MVWEVPRNIERAKASMSFIMTGCKCKTGCSTRRCSCQHKERICGPNCQCINCTNTTITQTTDVGITELEVEDLLQETNDDEYVDDSGDDLEEMREDQELSEIMDSVFGLESDEEDAV